MATFTEAQKKQLAIELKELAEASQNTAIGNQRWDIGFKVALLLLTVATTICSVVIATYDQKPPESLSVAVAILAGVSTALSAFAFTQFNFAGRQQSWQKRADAFASLRLEILYSEPDTEKFLARMNVVRSWGDTTPRDETTDQE
jgi:RsiW-degrading membrane proteinase PrsW (M82 family)